MNPADLVALFTQLQGLMTQAGTQAGDVMHTVVQLRDAMALTAQGFDVSINQQVRTQVITAGGELLEIIRVVDVVGQRVGQLDLHIEEKTGSIERAFPTLAEGFRQGEHNLQLLADLTAGASGQVNNLWRIYSTPIDEATPLIERRMNSWTTFMQEALGATEAQLRRAVESFRVEDAFGDAIEFTWSPNGPIARRALDAASHSPDFSPAMDVLFGPSGKVADSAQSAAIAANLEPALGGLEEKIEQGVTTALDEAGTAASAHAAQSLGQQISGGVTALGNVMTSIPQLHQSVTALGEAWNRPLNSTKDYMDLLAAAGGVVSQAGQVLQAFSGITEIASAAQAVFNAVMAMNPVVLVVIAVVALIAAIALLIVYWDQVKAALRDNPWIAVAAVMFGLIGIIIVVIAYWDEIKLAVLRAANFVSIQVQRIGMFFVGLGTLISQVWGFLVASVENVGIAILNAFITAGTAVQNFFIGIINWIIDKYNSLADSALGSLVGLDTVDLIPEVDVQTRLIPPREVPEINVDAAFGSAQVTGGLEGQIAAQEEVVAQAQRADEQRRAQEAVAQPAAPTAPGAVAPALPAGPAGERPALPGALPAAPGGAADQSVTVNGGINITITADRLEADSAQLLTDEIVAQLQARLGSLRSTQDFQAGARPAMA